MTKEFDTSFELVCDRPLRHGERAWVSYQVPVGSPPLWLITAVNESTYLDDSGAVAIERDRDHVWLVHDLRVGCRSERKLSPQTFAAMITLGDSLVIGAVQDLMIIEMLVEYVGKWRLPAMFRCSVNAAFERPKLPPVLEEAIAAHRRREGVRAQLGKVD